MSALRGPVTLMAALLCLGTMAAVSQTAFVGIRELPARQRGLYHAGEEVSFEVAGLAVSREAISSTHPCIRP